ncbi:MAG TPA: hypothetical protein VIR05_08725 [Luteimonas sp.]
MSIERSQSPTQPDAARDVGRDKADTRPREPAPREKVDDFQRLLQGKREQREPRLPTQPEEARQPQQAARREGQQAPTRQQEDAAIAGHRQASERYGDDPALRHRDDTGGTQAQQTLDPAALYQAQMAMRDGLPQATTPTPLNPNAFADMVERHLKQMATDRGAAADAGDGRVLLRMADATLPGTDLLLSRTPEGWVLRADVRSRSSFDAIREAAPALARRFAERNLGTLSIDPHFHG